MHMPLLTLIEPVRMRLAMVIARAGSPRGHAARQTIAAVIGNADRVFVVLEGDHHQHRAEDFLLGNAHVIGDIDKAGRLDEIAAAEIGASLATAEQRRAFLLAEFDIAHHPVPTGAWRSPAP